MTKIKILWSEDESCIFMRRKKPPAEKYFTSAEADASKQREKNMPVKGDPAMKEAKIMLVDDEDRFLSTTKKLMMKKGYEVITAGSGTEVFNLMQQHLVHVVILDVKMPGMDGITILKEIKKRYPLVEVIMLTGHATVESAVEGLKLGAIDYLMKPTSIDDLAQKVEEALNKRDKMEEKIRLAQARIVMKSPRQIIRESENLHQS